MLPASFQAAVIGTGLTLVWIAADAVIVDGLPDPVFALKMALATIIVAFIPIIIATVFCAIYIGVVGVPIAALLGAQLDTRTGLAVAIGATVVTGLAAMVVFGFRPLLGGVDWPFAQIVFAYALPAGLLYRRAVLNARMLNPFAEPTA